MRQSGLTAFGLRKAFFAPMLAALLFPQLATVLAPLAALAPWQAAGARRA